MTLEDAYTAVVSDIQQLKVPLANDALPPETYNTRFASCEFNMATDCYRDYYNWCQNPRNDDAYHSMQRRIFVIWAPPPQNGNVDGRYATLSGNATGGYGATTYASDHVRYAQHFDFHVTLTPKNAVSGEFGTASMVAFHGLSPGLYCFGQGAVVSEGAAFYLAVCLPNAYGGENQHCQGLYTASYAPAGFPKFADNAWTQCDGPMFIHRMEVSFGIDPGGPAYLDNIAINNAMMGKVHFMGADYRDDRESTGILCFRVNANGSYTVITSGVPSV
jgi:hypothetical protein